MIVAYLPPKRMPTTKSGKMEKSIMTKSEIRADPKRQPRRGRRYGRPLLFLFEITGNMTVIRGPVA